MIPLLFEDFAIFENTLLILVANKIGKGRWKGKIRKGTDSPMFFGNADECRGVEIHTDY